MLCARRITRREPHVPVIGCKAFIVARGIVVGLQFDRNAEMGSERASNDYRHATESAVGGTGYSTGLEAI